jgi:hypothetical protein
MKELTVVRTGRYAQLDVQTHVQTFYRGGSNWRMATMTCCGRCAKWPAPTTATCRRGEFAALLDRGWSEGDRAKLAGATTPRVPRDAESVARKLYP